MNFQPHLFPRSHFPFLHKLPSKEHACLETPTGKFPSCGPTQAKSKGWYSLNSHKVIDPISFLIEPELNSAQIIPAIQEIQYSLFTLKKHS